MEQANMWDVDQRYHVRGYFTGDGQCWLAIWDAETGRYHSDSADQYPTLFRRDECGIEQARLAWIDLDYADAREKYPEAFAGIPA